MADAVQTDAGDELLARLLGELSDTLRRGKTPDVEGVVRAHPQLGSELRELWAAVQVAEELGKTAGQSRTTLDLPVRNAVITGTSPAATVPLNIPKVVGDYELLEEIGRGGMGVVFKAYQRSLGRIVALKMILRGELASAAELARFRAEAEAAARLEHPNIITVHEVGETDSQAYFSMRYVEGKTLAGLLTEGPLPPRLAAEYVATVARAVHHAHQQGILHRDLKPSNVLIERGPSDSSQPVLVVTDFGLAKRVTGAWWVTEPERSTPEIGEGRAQALTASGAIVGTPAYMAPEQAAGGRGSVGPASDVYSLGSILYELLTGRPPFQAAAPLDTILMVLEQEPVPPRRLNPKVDRELEMICLKCLQKAPEFRYASAAELAGDLEAFLHGEPVSARPSNPLFFIAQMLRETHHAAVLENWGMLWMLHSVTVFVICVVTTVMYHSGIRQHFPYLALWTAGLLIWGSVFWSIRKRGGPITFIERQLAHLYAAGILGSISMFLAEWQHGLPVLSLSPGLAVIAAMVFVVKAGMLSGWFYFAALGLLATSTLMNLFPDYSLILFGLASGLCFFLPGQKYYRQKLRSMKRAALLSMPHLRRENQEQSPQSAQRSQRNA